MNNIECSTLTSSLELKDFGRIEFQEVKKIVENFPWDEEIEKIKDEEIAFAALVELYTKDFKGTSLNIMSFEKGSYIVDIQVKKSNYYLFILPKVTEVSMENLSISQVLEYTKNFYSMEFEELFEWVKEEKRNQNLKVNAIWPTSWTNHLVWTFS